MIISVPFLWMTEFSSNPNQCFLNLSKNDMTYVFGYNVLLIILPTIGLMIFYLMIIHKLKKRDKFLKSKLIITNSRSLLIHKNCIKERRLTIIISFVSFLFYCCQLPSRLFLSWAYINDMMEINYETSDSQLLDNFSLFNILSEVFALIYFLHCVTNPIIYNLLSSKFRKSFMSVFNLRVNDLYNFTVFIYNEISMLLN